MPEEYQGHPSHAHWNVALWVSNVYGLYEFARRSTREAFLDWCATSWPETDDGVKVTPELAGYAWDDVHED